MKQKVFLFLKIFIIIIVFYFIGVFFKKNIGELRNYEFQIDYFYLILSITLFLSYIFICILNWQYITIKMTCSVPFHNAAVAWCYSFLGKFIPGKMAPIAARAYFYKQAGISYKKITFCAFLESIMIVFSLAFAVSLVLFFVDIGDMKKYRFLLLLLLPVSFVTVHPRILELFINLVAKVFKKNIIKLSLTYYTVLKILLMYILLWIVLGIAFFFFAKSIHSVPIDHMFPVIGSFFIATLVGILSIFTPSGLGVREGILTIALSHIFPSSIAVVISVSSRIWSTSLELFVILIMFIIARMYGIKFKEDCNGT
jgi:glycosyltransferase 2 family protein